MIERARRGFDRRMLIDPACDIVPEGLGHESWCPPSLPNEVGVNGRQVDLRIRLCLVGHRPAMSGAFDFVARLPAALRELANGPEVAP